MCLIFIYHNSFFRCHKQRLSLKLSYRDTNRTLWVDYHIKQVEYHTAHCLWLPFFDFSLDTSYLVSTLRICVFSFVYTNALNCGLVDLLSPLKDGLNIGYETIQCDLPCWWSWWLVFASSGSQYWVSTNATAIFLRGDLPASPCIIFSRLQFCSSVKHIKHSF